MRLLQRAVCCGCLLAGMSLGQTAGETSAFAEQNELNQVLGEAGNSPVEIIRGLERYLRKYPDTKQRLLIERRLAHAAMDSNDSERIVVYGEKVLATPPDDVQLLDRVMRELDEKKDPESARKALEYGKRYEAGLAALRGQPPQQHMTPGQWSEQLERAMARVFSLEAEAYGNAGDPGQAVQTALKSWGTYPTGDGARIAAGWMAKTGRTREAIEKYADAFTLEDPSSLAADRVRDRARMGDLYAELYAKLHGSQAGLGDIILQAFDRNTAMLRDRAESVRRKDPNSQAISVFDFTLPPGTAAGPGSQPLVMASLKGKTVVLDFWATWCIPCRAQHPLIENVRAQYAQNPDVVFVAVDADDNPGLVQPFLKEQGWTNATWLEGGLERQLAINSIPTTIVLDPAGRVSSRMQGMIPERFEDMLRQRIEDARHSSLP